MNSSTALTPRLAAFSTTWRSASTASSRWGRTHVFRPETGGRVQPPAHVVAAQIGNAKRSRDVPPESRLSAAGLTGHHHKPGPGTWCVGGHSGHRTDPPEPRLVRHDFRLSPPAGSMSVRIGELEPERHGEGSHVVPIAPSRFVPAVMFDLKLGGQAGYNSAD